jgi:DNA-binding NarL/FixJ family response regulator
MTVPKHRVLIADDHPIVLEGLRSLLASDNRFQIVGKATDGNEVISQAEAQRPDLVLLDISMPHVDGTEIIAQLKRQLPQARIVIHTVHASLQKLHECLSAGVEGYVVKGDEHASPLAALTCVADGKYYLSPSISKTLVERYLLAVRAAPSDQHFWETLTPREREVIRLSAQGLTVKQVAKHLDLSPKTINNHLIRMKNKLNVSKTTALIRYALESGLIESDD